MSVEKYYGYEIVTETIDNGDGTTSDVVTVAQRGEFIERAVDVADAKTIIDLWRGDVR